MVQVVVRPAVEVQSAAAVAVVQIAEEAALLPQAQADQWAVPVLVLVLVSVLGFVLVWVLVSAAENKSGFLVLHGSEPIIFHRLHH